MLDRTLLQRGLTLIELLVAMAIGGIIMTAIVTMFGNQTRTMALQDDLVALEQNLRSALDFLYRDVRIAGAYSKDSLAPFTIGAIDHNADGVTDLQSEGGGNNPDAIQLRFSPDPGIRITNYSGAAANLRVCAPSGLNNNQALLLSSPATPSLVRSIQITSIGNVSCPGDGCPGNNCDRINFVPGPSALNSPGGLAGAYEGGRIWDKLETITYFQTNDANGDGNPNDPALMRVRNREAPAVVAFGITNLQVVYILRNGTETTAPTLPPPDAARTIERVRLTVTGETRNTHAIGGGAPFRRTRNMITEVQVRNLAF